jgi:diphthine-ammonia ligase
LFFIQLLLPTNHFFDLEELDSYLYQTVGQDAIHLVARALEVPLYRRVITGNAIEQSAEYGGRNDSTGIDGDETEDLLDLLSTVKVQVFPFFFTQA